MVESEKIKFLNAFGAMCLLFGREASRELIDIYFTALSGFTIAQIEKSISHAMVTCRFFPKPVELIEAIQGTCQDKPLLAWLQVDKAAHNQGPYKSIKFADPVTMAVINSLGGWPKFCDCLGADWIWRQKEFITRYTVMENSGIDPIEYLQGIIEIENAARGFINHIPAPVMIGFENRKLLL